MRTDVACHAAYPARSETQSKERGAQSRMITTRWSYTVNFPINDTFRFDENHRLFAEQRLSLAHNQLRPDVALDTTLAYRLAAQYFAVLERASRPMIKVEVDQQGIQVNVRGFGTTLRFGVGEPDVSERRAAIGWSIVGGRMLAANADSGGTYTIGAEWDEPRQNFSLFTRVENYPPALTGLHAPPLRRLLYFFTQRQSHRFFTHRFLQEAAREFIHADGRPTPTSPAPFRGQATKNE